MALSAEAKAWAIEAVLSSHKNRWAERLARAAASEDDAIYLLRNEMNHGYGDCDGHRYDCRYQDIRVEYPDGTAGVLTWREVVRHARATARQRALPF